MTSAYSVCPDSPALSWMSPLNSSFDQTKCISSCFQRCFSHHQLKVKKAAEHKRMNRAFQAKVCEDGLVGWMDGLMLDTGSHQDGANCNWAQLVTPWIIYSAAVGSIIAEKLLMRIQLDSHPGQVGVTLQEWEEPEWEVSSNKKKKKKE